MRNSSIGLLCIVSAAGAGMAHADVISDCNQSRSSPNRIQACSEIIKDSNAKKETKARAYRNRAEARADAGAGAEAIADYSEALRLDANDAAALSGRGHARVNRGDNDGAIEDFAAAIKLKPDTAAYFMGRGYAHFVKDAFDPAIADFSEAIRLNSKSASALNHRGLAYRKKGDGEHAISDFTAAIALNPVYALAYNNRGYSYESAGRKADAIADFSKALSLDRSLTGAAAGLKRLGAQGTLAGETDAMIRDGKALVEANCSRCHSVGATADSPNPKAPPFRAIHQRHPKLSLREPLSRGIAAPHDEMPKFPLPDTDVDKIIAYINSLPSS
ncbi:MAG: tetratricopeptide repeat protein [Hyphomicrobium sp.]